MRRLSRWMMGALLVLAAYGVAASVLSPIWPDIGVAASLALVVLAFGALHWGLRVAEDRGWIYYRKRRGSYGGLGVTSEFLNMYDPSRRHLQQTVRERDWKREEDDDGDPPG